MVWARWYRGWVGAVLIAVFCMPASAERLSIALSEFPLETEALVAATESLFETAEARTELRRTDRLTPIPASADPTSPLMAEAFVTEHGPVRHLTGYRITWYPVDRLVGAVDFMGTWNNARNLVCGYVTWDVSDPEAPVLQSLVATYVDVAGMDEAEQFEREAALLEANCAFGDIDRNYATLN